MTDRSDFKKAYDEALKARERGDGEMFIARLERACAIMSETASSSSGEEREERLELAGRLRRILDKAKSSVRGRDSVSSGEKSDCELYRLYKSDDLSGFDDIVGMEEAKESVDKYVIRPILYPEFYKGYKLGGSKYILLEGPPGTGKTSFAKALSKELERPFAAVSCSALINAYIGETGKNIDRLFSELRDLSAKSGGITVFFDEFDEIALSAASGDKVSQASVPALKRNLDGLEKNEDMIIIANTNHADMLDKALLDRFIRKIEVGLPDERDREKLFRVKLSDVEKEYFENTDFPRLAEASEGMSGRDITMICEDFKFGLADVKRLKSENFDPTEALISGIEKRRSGK